MAPPNDAAGDSAANGLAHGSSASKISEQQQESVQNGSTGSNGPTDSSAINLAERLAVHRSPKEFGSFAYSLVSLPAGSLFSPITGTTSGTKAYSSVQTGPDSHIELNSDLVYCNQSCSPTLEFDMATMEVRVARERDLQAGDALTFWYPSTEWDMAQPFKCECGTGRCKGYINGAGQMEEQVVREYWLNDHIEKLLAARSGTKSNGAVQNGH